MPRTPLLSRIFRFAKDHNIAEQRDVSLQTVKDWRAEQGERKALSRRGFLAGAGAGAAMLALPKRARAAGNPTIAIIGGGIAGLSAALQLRDAGYASTVYEASSRLGGRMHSNKTYFNEGQTSEWCGELIDTNHKTIRALAKRFALNVVDVKAAAPNGSEDTFHFFGQYYSEAQANIDFNAVKYELQKAVNAAGYPTTYNIQNQAGIELDNTSLYDWIEQHVPGGHKSPMGAMLDVAYTEELAVDTRLQSSLNMIYLLGYQATPGNFEMFGISDERFHIAGGNDQLPLAIANTLGVGTTVKTGWSMNQIVKTSDGRFTVSFDVGGTAKTVTADYVVMCIPFSILRNLDYSRAGFDALKDYTIRNLGCGKSGKLQLQFTNRYWNSPGPWPGIGAGEWYSDVGFQNAWDVTRGQPGASGIVVNYTGGPVSAAMSTKIPYGVAGQDKVNTDAQRFLGQFEKVAPGAKARWNGKVASSLPHLDPFLKLSYSHWELGQYATIAGYEGVRQGNCVFAGEHTSIDFQGFMEGGAFSGQRAANEIIADLK